MTFFSKLKKNSFSNTIRVSNGLDPDQDRQDDHPDLDSNCLQSISTDVKSLLARKEFSILIVSPVLIK